MSQPPSPARETPPGIWVALRDPEARLRLEQAAAALRHVTRNVDPEQAGHPPASCVAIVSDLLPPGPSLQWLEQVRGTRQGIPVILYLPVRTGADSALTRAMSFGIDGLIFQRGKANERDRLHGVLEGVLDQQRVASLLDRLSATVPRSAIGFRLLKHYGIKLAGEVNPSDHLETVADALGSSPRTLQRLLRADGWPSPKELLDWMMLFLTALTGDLPTDRTVRRRVRRASERLLRVTVAEDPPALDAVIDAFEGRVRRLGL